MRVLTGAAVAILLPVTAAAQADTAGTYSMTLLNGGLGAAGTGRSNALTAWAVGPGAVYWNPAAAAATVGEERRLLLSGARLLGDLRQTALAYDTVWRELGVSVQLLYFGLGDIPVRGDLPTTDPIATTSAYDLVASLAVAVPLPGGGGAGLTVKGLYEKLDVADAAGAALDAGVQLPVNVGGTALMLGGAVRNLGRMGELEQERLDLPWSRAMGVALAEPLALGPWRLGAGLDWWKPADDIDQLRIGAQAALQSVRLRVGYRYGEGWNTFSTGLGLEMPGWSLDYAYVFDPDVDRRALGNVQRLGVVIRFGEH